jgi:methylmalonyl-CoA/ethylmalonyl-CoA epimerase
MQIGFSHVSIAVPDIEAAARMLKEKYGLIAGEVYLNEPQGVRLAYIDLGGPKIELIEPAHPDSPISKFLERNPRGGIHHFSLHVDDVDAATRELAAKGVRTLGDGKSRRNVAGGRIAFIHPHDFLGALVELEEHSEVS